MKLYHVTFQLSFMNSEIEDVQRAIIAALRGCFCVAGVKLLRFEEAPGPWICAELRDENGGQYFGRGPSKQCGASVAQDGTLKGGCGEPCSFITDREKPPLKGNTK